MKYGELCKIHTVLIPVFSLVSGWVVQKRLSYIECHWPYFVGFGLPLAVLTSLPSSIIVRSVLIAT